MKKPARQIWRRRGAGLYPANDEATAALLSIKQEKEVVGSFHGVRSTKQLKLWWALMGLLVDAGCFPIKEAASDATKTACGHFDVLIYPDTGETQLRPRSIRFESLPQDEFNPIFEAALDVICTRWIPADADDLRAEVFAAIDGPAAIGTRAPAVTPRELEEAHT